MHDPDVESARAILRDSGTVLETRRSLDALALDVLASERMGEPEVERFAAFVNGPWQAGIGALSRIESGAS